MISWFKKFFIPHLGNDHRPHILRADVIRNIILIIVILELSTFLIPALLQINRTGGMAAVLSSVLSDLTNVERKDQNLKTLTVNESLNKAAEMKAKDMATKGYFAHVSPEGKTPWYWIEKAGYQYQYAGENLAINFTDSKDVTNAWMASPTHKANIVKGKYTEIGTGVAVGMYQGRQTIFVAQVYANPLPKILTPAETKKTNIIKIEKVIKVNKEIPKNVLGAETETLTPIQKPTFLQKVFASPRNNTNMILYIIFGIMAVSLLLNIFIKIRHHHVDLITNGLITLALILAILIGNYCFSYRNMIITKSIDYSNEK